MVDHLAGHIFPPGASAQVDEDGGVDQDAAKHADEDPKIVKPSGEISGPNGEARRIDINKSRDRQVDRRRRGDDEIWQQALPSTAVW